MNVKTDKESTGKTTINQYDRRTRKELDDLKAMRVPTIQDNDHYSKVRTQVYKERRDGN